MMAFVSYTFVLSNGVGLSGRKRGQYGRYTNEINK